MSATSKFLGYAFCLTLSVISWRRTIAERELPVALPDRASFEELGYTFADGGQRIARYSCSTVSHQCLELDDDGEVRALYVVQHDAPVGVFRRYELTQGR